MKRVLPALAAVVLLAGAVPLHAQAGGLLGDDGLSEGGGPTGPAERPAPRRAPRQQRVVNVTPYLEVDQTAIWDLKGNNGRDMLTYTTVAAGVSANVQTRAVAIGADVRVQHQFAWSEGQADSTMVSGLVAARTLLVPNLLSLEGGALATRVRSDGFTGANNSLVGADTSNVYSLYAGPTLSAPVGDLTVNAAYRLGYNRVDTQSGSALALGVPVGGVFDESWIHSASASVGMQPGPLPFGWSIGTGWLRETASQLDQRFDQKFVRADVTLPVSYTVALVGGVGYEKIEIGNRDALRDAAGLPIVDQNGRYVTDPASPRRLSYDQDGIIWDAGVLWRPSPRLSAEGRVGHRYGSMSYTGSLGWQPGARTSINVVLFDSIDSFGRALNSSLANLGTDFYVGRNPFSGDLGGCAYGGGGGAGACFGDTLTGLAAANFRSRGVFAQYAHRGDALGLSVSAGYARRRLIADSQSVLASAAGLVDENYYASLGATLPLSAVSVFDARAYVNYFDSGVDGVADVANIGANMSYGRTIWRRLQMSAAVGIDSIDRKGEEAFLSLLAQIGLRYSF